MFTVASCIEMWKVFCANLNSFSLYDSCGSSKWRRVSCEQQLNNSSLVPDSVEEIRVFQACASGWRCDTRCRALAQMRKCAFFPLVSVPCFVASANAISQETFCRLRHVSVHLDCNSLHMCLLSVSCHPAQFCTDSSTHLRWLKISSWRKKRVAW